MDTQNTPVHLRLWHRGFWLLAFANLLLTMAIYMLIILMGDWQQDVWGLPGSTQGCLMGAYGVGLFLLGPFCSWWVQRYRRNHVCLTAIAAVMAVIAAFWFMQLKYVSWHLQPWHFGALRLMLGATFGLAQMVLSSTLIIDVCESFQRTEANHSSAWFSRFALSLGPVLALVLVRLPLPVPYPHLATATLAAIALTAISALLIMMVPFPFRAPDDQLNHFSLDRFFLPSAWPLILNLLLVAAVAGFLLAIERNAMFYAMMMAGFFLALLAQRYVFADADLKSEPIAGLFLLVAALLIREQPVTQAAVFLAPVLLGVGFGLIGSRFLLFFIKLSRHCQRGTSQSTFFLTWEAGISIGLLMGYASPTKFFCISLTLTVAALAIYHFFTHNWYLRHKNR